MYMKTLNQRMIGIKNDEIVKKAISDYYFEKGEPEPIWYVNKNPQWWVDYLRDIGLGPNNEPL